MYLALPPMSIMTWNTEGACLKIVHERGAGCPTPSSGRYTFFFSLMLAKSWVFGAVRQKQSALFAHRLLNTRARNSESGQSAPRTRGPGFGMPQGYKGLTFENMEPYNDTPKP